MDYELAEELKDAGFPQNDTHFQWRVTYSGLAREHSLTCNENYETKSVGEDRKMAGSYLIAAPTLEELIEACGKRFSYLSKTKFYGRENYHDWIAHSGATLDGLGSTPVIAVARLWLALHKKP